MGLDKTEKLMIDHEKAKQHIERSKARITNAFIARVAILNGAIQDFNTFRDLPAEDNRGAAIFWLAFSIVSAAVPALRIAEFLKKQQNIAENALILAEALGAKGSRAGKVIVAATKGADAAAKAAKHAEEVKGIIDKAKAAFPTIEDKPGHISRWPILELIKDINEAPKTWETVEDLLMQEWENRLADLPTKGSLEEVVKRHLTPPDDINPDDAKEIWNMYLFEMILQHCKNNIYWDHTVFIGAGRNTKHSWELVGINGNQKKFIVQWFGPAAKRAKYFKRPIITNFDVFLKQWPVRQKLNEVYAEIGNRV